VIKGELADKQDLEAHVYYVAIPGLFLVVPEFQVQNFGHQIVDVHFCVGVSDAAEHHDSILNAGNGLALTCEGSVEHSLDDETHY
jgi:hypothetical protein